MALGFQEQGWKRPRKRKHGPSPLSSLPRSQANWHPQSRGTWPAAHWWDEVRCPHPSQGTGLVVLAGRPGLTAWLYLRNQTTNISQDVAVAERAGSQLEASPWLLPPAGRDGRSRNGELEVRPSAPTLVTSSLSLAMAIYKMGLGLQL